MIDFHSHILPGVDDGSSDLEMSLAMLQAEKEQGVTTVVATPHFYAVEDAPERFLARRQAAAEQLREAAAKADLPEIVLGAEVAYFRGMSDSEALWDLRIADTNYILVEPPLAPWNRQVLTDLRDLTIKQNLFPIIAHVERYLIPFWGRKMLKQLQELPVLIQSNASFFLEKESKTALRLLRDGHIHLLGSDCHDLKERCPRLGNAFEIIGQKLGEDALAHVRDHEQLVLCSD